MKKNKLKNKIKKILKTHRHRAKPQEPRLNKKFNKKELLDYRKSLIKRKNEILDGINHISEDTLKKSQKDAAGDISGYTFHMADVATDNYDREFSLGIASNEREMLYELDDAMKRIEEGTFGVCEDCKSPITKTRLRAIPYARLCLNCQQKREKR
jgi:RNA polymerase-binding protein DksA